MGLEKPLKKDELVREMYNPPKPEFFNKRKKTKQQKLDNSQQVKEKEIFEESLRMFRLINFSRIQYLDGLEITDKRDDNERKMRCELEFFSAYLISRYISLRLKLIRDTSEEWKKKILTQNIHEKEKQIQHYDRLKFSLDNIIVASVHLRDRTLPEEQRKYYSEKREKYRKLLSSEIIGTFNVCRL